MSMHIEKANSWLTVFK